MCFLLFYINIYIRVFNESDIFYVNIFDGVEVFNNNNNFFSLSLFQTYWIEEEGVIL
jgi:hypothetical protein